MTKKIIIIGICIIVYKAISNLINLLTTKRYKTEFIKYLSQDSSRIVEHRLQTIKLFKRAGIKDTSTPISQGIGYGQVANFNASVFHNFPSTLQVIAYPALEMFDSAIGIYKSRIIESFNPIYWIEQILFLPKNLLTYIGLNSENTAFKICNVLLSFIWWLLGTTIILFKTQLQQFIIEFIGNL